MLGAPSTLNTPSLLAISPTNLSLLDPIQHSQALFLHHLVTEAAGVFWLAAELAILAGLLVARRILENPPLPPRFSITPRETRCFWLMTFTLFALTTALFARHLLYPTLPQRVIALASNPLPDPAPLVSQLYFASTRLHLSVWTAFITGWIALEAAIIYHGIRVFITLRRLLRIEIPKERARINPDAQ